MTEVFSSIQLDIDLLISSDAIGAAVSGSTSEVEVVRVGPENSLQHFRFCGLKILGNIIACSGCKHSFHPETNVVQTELTVFWGDDRSRDRTIS